MYALAPIAVAVRVAVERPRPATVLLVLVAVSPWVAFLAGRTFSWPAFVGATFLPTALLLVMPMEDNYAPLFLVLMVGASARVQSRRASLLTAAAAIALLYVFQGAGWYEARGIRFSGAGMWSVTLLAAWVIGVVVQLQERVVVAQRRARRAMRERAVAAERAHLARELHDAIGRSVTVMMLHVNGARRALGRDPADAARALELAEEAGRSSMADIRRTVRLLADHDQRVDGPGAADIEELVNEFTRAGMRVSLHRDGDVSTVPVPHGLVLYRVVEESLTNAAKHAPDAPVEIDLVIETREGRLVVSNPASAGAPARGGRGLVGMEQRARQLGGVLQAGRSDGEWRVELSMPWGSSM